MEKRCKRCNRIMPATDMHSSCEKCRAKMSAWVAAKRTRRKENGLCVRCGAKLPDQWMHIECDDCRYKSKYRRNQAKAIAEKWPEPTGWTGKIKDQALTEKPDGRHAEDLGWSTVRPLRIWVNAYDHYLLEYEYFGESWWTDGTYTWYTKTFKRDGYRVTTFRRREGLRQISKGLYKGPQDHSEIAYYFRCHGLESILQMIQEEAIHGDHRF